MKKFLLSTTALLLASISIGAGFARSSSAHDIKLQSARVRHVESTDPVKYPWGSIRWLMNSEIDPDAEQTFGIVEIKAGERNTLHMHPNSDELLYVLSGSCDHVVGDRTVHLHTGDLLRVPRNTKHQALVTGHEPLRAVISYSTPRRQVVNLGDKKE